MIHGERSTKLKSNENIASTCSSCNKENTVRFTVFQQYLHVLFIPYFASGKYVISTCSACDEMLNQENRSPIYLEEINKAKK